VKNLNDLKQVSQNVGSRRKDQDAWFKACLGVDIEAIRLAASMPTGGPRAQPAGTTCAAASENADNGPSAQPAGAAYRTYTAAPENADNGPSAQPAGAAYATYTAAPENADNAPQVTARKSREFDPVDPTPTPTGMKTKRVSDTYEGEHNKAGWRSSIDPSIDPENTRFTTKLYSEEEQAANRLVQQPDGAFQKGDGSAVSGKMGYVMDASGRMVAFKDRLEKVNQDGTRSETTRPFFDLKKDPSARVEVRHHSTALGGDAVVDASGRAVLDAEGRPMMRSKAAAAAGMVQFDAKGKIKSISNASGHYKPTVDYLLQGVEHLLKQGAFFEDELTRLSDDVPEGERHKPLAADDPDYKLYKTLQGKLEEGQSIAVRVRELTKALDDAEHEDEQAEIGGNLEKIKGELDALKAYVDEAQQKLRKAGVGPSNRIRQDAKAEFLDVEPDMTGAQVRTTRTKKMGVASFLQTGGGNEAQAARKKVVLDELKRNAKSKQDK
jgi:hypothetical protein